MVKDANEYQTTVILKHMRLMQEELSKLHSKVDALSLERQESRPQNETVVGHGGTHKVTEEPVNYQPIT